MCVYKYFRYQIILCFYVKYIFYVSRHFFSFLCSCFYRYIHAIKFFFTSDFTRNVRFSHFFFVSQLSIFSPKLDRGSLTLWKQIWVFTFQPRETKEREREISPTTRLKYLEIQKLAGTKTRVHTLRTSVQTFSNFRVYENEIRERERRSSREF